jgi:arylsulfatase A-like enzyme
MKTIVFAIRGCPTGWLGAYGNDWVGTPHLDRFAAEAVVFDSHFSDCPEPTAARVAWCGGPQSLASRLNADTHTLLVRANHPDTDGPAWFYAGWSEVFDARPEADDESPLDHLLRVFPAILDKLANAENVLLWIETDRLLPPWDVQQDVFEAYLDAGTDEPEDTTSETRDVEFEDDDEEDEDEDAAEPVAKAEEPEATAVAERLPPCDDPPTGMFARDDLDAWDWLHCTFAALITKLDAELGTLFQQLRERGFDQNAAWVVTSDFGYPLGEHGQVGLYRPWLHEELVHLPLLLRLPNAEQAGRRVAAFTQPPDLHAMLLTRHGIAVQHTGSDLLQLATGQTHIARDCAYSQLTLGDATELAIRTSEWALVLPIRVPEGDAVREPRLFHKPEDRWEVNDLRRSNLELAEKLELQLRTHFANEGTGENLQ